MSFTLDEVGFLSTHADEIVNATAELSFKPTTVLADATALRGIFGEHGRAVAELARARQSARGKVPDSWLVDVDSAQQATPARVADLRAQRLLDHLGQDALIHDVTCSVGTEGASISAAGMAYLGSDLDRVRLAMARHNLGNRAWLAQADALEPISSGAQAIVADPARRAGGRRIVHPDQLLPPLPDLLKAWAGKELAVKCAPGLDFSEWDGLVSLVSVDGGVKEACLYTPGLSEGASREAAMITGEKIDRITDAGPDDVTAAAPGTWIIDPDGAVVRAGLVRHYAHREGLWMLDERIAYLTGDRIPQGRSGFRFIEQVPLKKLRPALHAHGAGSLEILVRGVDIDPDALRKKLRLAGDRPMAVVCTRIGRQGVALICSAREFSE
ncbi:THUMP-like domain-containing protein [Corynebacterium alimapuense]|uniref:SAM-dependent methyltransferase n=1 Tax=Corynebacterium alimapuense TaxID=1576874 RepID=A0A3M8K5A0_9CORY|nr:SAM-dependent methyltransferase [Corynebacterium alimapuense]RNE48381.1 SAM-dependent methyltransferase [Corynebacterium alimapuense]